MTILIVDDSRIMRNVVKNCFSLLKIPAQYLEANNGKEALLRLQSQPVNLVLLDWNMPEMSGIEFLKKVRAIDKFKTLPIIMITSEGARYSVIEALKAGATDYLVKPLTEKHLKEKVFKIISP
ncbi:MAG: response regulator [Spirochaetaceae bacterium]|jgi:two-component system chemotaxis response regulator CheY|nr:response regulator [Spirochaetaceae bacterium]